MITPRATRLVRVADLQAFREATIALAREGSPFDARDRLVVVPTRAAAAHLLRSLEDTLAGPDLACVLPDLITPGELVTRFADRLGGDRPLLTPAEREVLLGVACRSARDAGAEPPFQLRPGLVAEILAFYDTLRRHQKDVATFERLALGILEPGASYDRGAERLVRQTRFLVAAFREFERRSTAAGADEHSLRHDILHIAARKPLRHVVLTVGDRSIDPNGLTVADWDLLARVPGLERLDIVITDRMLAGAFHERIHRLLPGIEELRFETGGESPLPALVLPSADALIHQSRDREDEVAGFARRVKQLVRRGQTTSLDRVALVVRQPLPYVYVTREVLRSAGIPCQLFDALPLAAEPYAAAVDLVFAAVSASFPRGPSVALLRSPHFHFEAGTGERLSAGDVAALDRALSEHGYLGEADALDRLIGVWDSREPSSGRLEHARRAALTLQAVVNELLPLCSDRAVSDHLDTVLAFLAAHENPPGPDDALRSRQLRARGAIVGTLGALRDAYARFDSSPVPFDDVAALVRRWIDGQTFAPRTGDTGVHIVDAASAPFGQFEHVQLAGLVEGEWPDRPRRNIFYSSSILRELGWSAESERLDSARSAFADLIRLPSARLVASTFLLEADSLVSPSSFADELEQAQLEGIEDVPPPTRIFDYEALAVGEPVFDDLSSEAREWAIRRREAPAADEMRFRGFTSPHHAKAYSLSALERYQDCPFKFFSADVLRLEEAPEDEDTLSPRARGRFIHEVFQQFFEAWDRHAGVAITPERIDEARALFATVADPLLDRLPNADAALERARLFGSAIAVGVVDVVLSLEASRPAAVKERWLEYRFEGAFALGDPSGRTVPLRGVADRVDLLAGNLLRVFDYKTGSAPNPKRALQVPIYALCAQELLEARDGSPWRVDEAAYVAFSGKRSLVPVVTEPQEAGEVLAAARSRVLTVVDGIARGEFPPRPHDPAICRYCAYASVCRKDYVGDE